MKAGQSVKVVLPPKIGIPFKNFNLDWLAWIQELNNQTVELVEDNMMLSSIGAIDGWDIKTHLPVPNFEVCSWAPSQWLVEVKPNFSGFCQSCNGFRKHRLMCPLT